MIPGVEIRLDGQEYRSFEQNRGLIFGVSDLTAAVVLCYVALAVRPDCG